MKGNPGQKQISVTIPVYKPDLNYLKQTLSSVFDNGVDREILEVIIVNDYCVDETLTSLIESYQGALSYHCNEQPLGIAGNWNRCIELATCPWIHILHQDDVVLHGFYAELLRIQQDVAVGAFTARYFTINEYGNITSVSPLEQQMPGFMEAAQDKIIRTNTIQCPSIIVKKEVYSRIGAFNPALKYVLDWEMWFRLSLHCRIWYEPKPLVCFRKHSTSESPRVKESGESARDMIKGAAIISNYAPEFAARARDYGATHIIETAIEFLMLRKWKHAVRQLRLAPLCLREVLFQYRYWRCWSWALRIAAKNGLIAFRNSFQDQ